MEDTSQLLQMPAPMETASSPESTAATTSAPQPFAQQTSAPQSLSQALPDQSLDQQPPAQMLPHEMSAHNFGQPDLMALQAAPTSNTGNPAMHPQQQSSSANYPATSYPRTSPGSTSGPGVNNNMQPQCQNCATSTTPLWRRDEMGSVLCNACGLFLKLHGRPRPISLKTDVIKSRNRVKTMRPDLAKKKQQQQQQAQQNLQSGTNANGNDMTGANMAAALGGRRPSKTNGHLDDTQSPISRTGTPNMYNNHGLPMYPNMDDSQFQANGLASFGVGGTGDGRVPSPMNGEHPSTQESLLQENASLKTRVSELEVIQELYRGRLQQLEQDEQNAQQNKAQLHAQLEAAQHTEGQLRNELEESHHRENMLKRRLDELELELSQTRGSVEAQDNERHAKRPRLDNNDMAPVLAESAINNDDIPQDPALKDHPTIDHVGTDNVSTDNVTNENAAAEDAANVVNPGNDSVAEDALQALKAEPVESAPQVAT